MEEKKKNWAEARDFCRAIGGDLLSIHSSRDLNRNEYAITTTYTASFSLSLSLCLSVSLYTYIKSMQLNLYTTMCCCFLYLYRPISSSPAWIGFSLNPSKGFVWSDGSPVCFILLLP